MTSENCITFYDIPGSTAGKAGSPNTWRARYVLNFKGVEYKTTWLEYPEIEPLCKSLGFKPTAKKMDGSDLYTCPAIYDPNNGSPQYVSDSIAIAEYLDNKYPESPLFPFSTKTLQMVFIDRIRTTVAPLIMLGVSESYKILSTASQPYFRATREAKFGKKIEEFCPEGPEREAVYTAAQANFTALSSLMIGPGPFVLGDQVTYADISLGCMLKWFKAVSEHEIWARISAWDNGRWDKFLTALDDKYGQVPGEQRGVSK